MRDPDMGRMVITRRRGERIFIGDDIEVTVIRAEEGHARLAIMAPKNVVIDRPDANGDRHDRENFRAWLEDRS